MSSLHPNPQISAAQVRPHTPPTPPLPPTAALKKFKPEPTAKGHRNERKGNVKKKGKGKKGKGKDLDPVLEKVLESYFGPLASWTQEEDDALDAREPNKGEVMRGRVSDLTPSDTADGARVGTPDWLVFVPFSLPEEEVEYKIYRHEAQLKHSFADLVT
ncbi:hypothetical protein BT69DRAFT_1326871, partial [Atractiella rhizophila]